MAGQFKTLQEKLSAESRTRPEAKVTKLILAMPLNDDAA